MSEESRPAVGARQAERAINAPLVVVALTVVLVAAHGLRVLLDVSTLPFAATSQDLRQGAWAQFVTYQFVHASWAHVLVNSAFILAFGAPVGRYFGESLRGGAVFLVFFIVCGVLSAMSYGFLIDWLAALSHAPPPPWALVGASGAASGVMGGAVRLIQGRGRIGRLGGRTILAATAGWIAINILLGVTGLTPGVGVGRVAWEAHITGYFAGLFLIGVFGRAAGQSRLRAGG